MPRNRSLLAAAFLTAGLAWAGLARAGEDAPTAAPAAPAPAAAEAPKTAETPATKTPSPIHSVLGWIGKQVAPDLECPCPATDAGEKAWRAWFAAEGDVPLASLRTALVADGWTADKMITFFKENAPKAGKCGDGSCAQKCKDGACADGPCAKEGGCCKGKDGGGCCKKKEGATPEAAKPEAEPKAKP